MVARHPKVREFVWSVITAANDFFDVVDAQMKLAMRE
jgi:hypothetical protein